MIKVLNYSECDRIAILKEFKRTPEMVREDVESFKEWMMSQPHFPEIISKWGQARKKLETGLIGF